MSSQQSDVVCVYTLLPNHVPKMLNKMSIFVCTVVIPVFDIVLTGHVFS